MKRYIPAIILFSFILISGFSGVYAAENKTRIVVFDLESKSKDLSSDEVATLSDYIRTSFINAGNFDVISREQLNKVMEEYKFQKAGLTEETNVIRLGKILNVDNAVMGTVGKFGDTYIINIKMLNLETARYISAESIKASSKNDCLASIDDKVNIMAQRISAEKGGEEKITESEGAKSAGNISKPSPQEISSRHNLCPDGDFTSNVFNRINGGYSVYNSALDGKWQLIVNITANLQPDADVQASIEKGQAHIKISYRRITNEWGVQLCMFPINIENGKNYRVTFSAKSEKIKKIWSCLVRVGGNWDTYGWQSFQLTPDLNTYSYKFKMNLPTDQTARLDFNVNDSTGEVWISGVRVEEIKD